MIRRKIVRERKIKKGIKDMSVSECRIYAYYLYTICKFQHDNYPDNENDCDFLAVCYTIFKRLAERMNLEGRVSDALAKIILGYETHGVLTPCDSDEKGVMCFHRSKIPYSYREDSEVEDLLRHGAENLGLMKINLYRCFYATQSNEIFLALIANYLINKTPKEDPSLLREIPSHLKKMLADTSKFDFVTNAVAFSDEEVQFLMVCYRLNSNTLFSNLLENFGDAGKNEIYQILTGVSEREFQRLSKKGGKLRSFGFVDADFDVDADFLECIQEGSMQPYFCDLLKKDESDSCYDLDSFTVNKNTCKIMSRMLNSSESVSLLLYGKPGSGKTEFAKSLAKSNGLNAYLFKNEREVEADKRVNTLCRLNCLLSMASDDCVYIIDEADSLLRTCDTSFFGLPLVSPTKGTVNKMLEENRNKIIWIVNFTSQMDESTLRRFTYSYRFEAMTRTQLRTITESKLQPLNLPHETNTQILDLMEQYKVTGASVDNVVKTIRSLGCDAESCLDGEQNGGESELVGCVKSVLKENALLLNGKSRMRETVHPNYDLRVLNASMSPAQIVQMVKNARDFAAKNQNMQGSQNGIRMLFYGTSGTGKTEFARYISQQLGSKILLKRASDILSKWVGESEQNIRDAFEEAERTESILLFDEADSFFASRENAEHSWERTQVNEFLTQMEEFPGILICTTNLKNIMDSAMNRRFHIITEFKPMNAGGIKTLLSRYFGGMPFAEKNVSRLESLHSVTPGDFGVLASRIRFMSEAERTENYIIEELCKLQDEKQGAHRTIGFSAN